MSRIGKLPVQIPDSVTLEIKGNVVTAKGPKGELAVNIDPEITIEQKDGNLHVLRPSDEKTYRAMHGLYRALIANMIQGITEGYEKRLEVIGVGFRALMNGKNIVLSVGLSHDTVIKPPEEIEFAVEKNVIIVRGINKQVVGQVAAKIRSLRPPEPYKGKGIRYQDEYIRRKAGKSA